MSREAIMEQILNIGGWPSFHPGAVKGCIAIGVYQTSVRSQQGSRGLVGEFKRNGIVIEE
jgi:hypothetical protein